MLIAPTIDGLITCDYRKDLNVENIPAVVYGHTYSDVDCIAIDYKIAFQEAAEYLTGLGHCNIGYIGPDGVRFQSLSGNVPENGRP